MSEKPILYIYHTDRIPLEMLTLSGILITIKRISEEQLRKFYEKVREYFEVVEKYYPEYVGIMDKYTIIIYRDRIYDDYYGFYEDIYYIIYRVKVQQVDCWSCLVIPESERLQALLAEAGII